MTHNHKIAIMFFGSFNHCLEHIGLKPVITIREPNIHTTCSLKASIARLCRTTIRLMNSNDAFIFHRPFITYLATSVR